MLVDTEPRMKTFLKTWQVALNEGCALITTNTVVVVVRLQSKFQSINIASSPGYSRSESDSRFCTITLVFNAAREHAYIYY